MINRNQITIALSLMLLSTGHAQAAVTCTASPDCSVLGYTKTAADCPGGSVKCPFDKTKLFCLQGGGGNVFAIKNKVNNLDIVYSDGTTSSSLTTTKDAIGVALVFETNSGYNHGIIVSAHQPPATTWANAIKRCNDFVVKGTSEGDWRLPTLFEMIEINGWETESSTGTNQYTNLNNKIQLIEKITRDFVSGITNQVQARGLWGEESLRQLLESSGLQKDVTYFEQTAQDDKRPDFVVRLPNNRLIVIDSKTIFAHYDAYMQANDEETKKAELKAHVSAVRSTVSTLGTKAYQKSIEKICKKLNIEETGDPVEMVLMYVHPEGALSCALAADSSLLDYAKEHNVVLVSQSTLMGALQIVDTLWLNFRDDEKNKEIRAAAEKFIASFGKFLAAWIEVGDKLQDSLDAHRKTIKLIGKENEDGLVKTAQEIANLQPCKINEKTAKTIIKAGYDFTGERK